MVGGVILYERSVVSQTGRLTNRQFSGDEGGRTCLLWHLLEDGSGLDSDKYP